MKKLRSIATISNAAMPSDLKSYLVQKMENIEKTYHCNMGDSLSVILLEKQELSYLLDKWHLPEPESRFHPKRSKTSC